MLGHAALLLAPVLAWQAFPVARDGWLALMAPRNELAPAAPSVAPQADGQETTFALKAADQRRDPIFLFEADPAVVSGNTFEIRFESAEDGIVPDGRVFYVSGRLMSPTVRLMAALPASSQDFALMGSASARERARASVTLTSRAQPQAVAAAYGGGGWEELEGADGSAASLAPAGLSAPTLLGTGSLDAVARARRVPIARDHVVRALTVRPLDQIFAEAGLNRAERRMPYEAAVRLLDQQALQPGYLAAFRTQPLDGNPQITVVTHVSLFSATGRIGSIALGAQGTYARIDDPWSHRNLSGFADTDPGGDGGGQRFRIMDGLYAAGLRNGIPSNVVSAMVAHLARSHNVNGFIGPQDRFTLIYSDTPRDAARGTGQVLYVGVRHGGETLACYVLKPGADDDYACMTEKDTVIRMQGPGGFVTPVNGVLRSGFGPRRHPILGSTRMHKGVDWAAPTGTPIYAAMDGRVSFRGVRGGYGNYVKLDHANGLATAYAHMSRFAGGLRAGDRVRAGDVIGYVGSTGMSTGPHLHFELHADGRAVDPLGFRQPRTLEAGADEKDRLIAQIIRVESGGRADARNPRSTATGLGQFIDSTWMRMMRSYRPDLVASMSRPELLALRKEPTIAREMVYRLAAENEADIRRAGFSATAGNLYLAHFLGSAGAVTVLRAHPRAPLIEVVGPGVISANPFLSGKDSQWVIDWAARKMSGRRSVAAHGSTPVPLPSTRIRNARFRSYSQAIDRFIAEIEKQRQARRAAPI